MQVCRGARLVAEEEHHRAGVVELVHRVEVRALGCVDDIDHSEVLDFFSDACKCLGNSRGTNKRSGLECDGEREGPSKCFPTE